MRARGKRLCAFSEIAKTETLNIRVLKLLSGGDDFPARGLYSNDMEDIKPTHTIVMQCNELPHIPGHDNATWNRVRVIDYQSKFVIPKDLKKFPVPESEEEQFELKRFNADLGLERKLPDLAPGMLWYLFERYKSVKIRGLTEPEIVTESTSKYRQTNDMYMRFEQEKIVKDSDSSEEASEEPNFLPFTELFNEFTDWYRDENELSAKESKISKTTFKNEFTKKWGAPVKLKNSRVLGWQGYKIVFNESENTNNKKQENLLTRKRKTN